MRTHSSRASAVVAGSAVALLATAFAPTGQASAASTPRDRYNKGIQKVAGYKKLGRNICVCLEGEVAGWVGHLSTNETTVGDESRFETSCSVDGYHIPSGTNVFGQTCAGAWTKLGR